MVNGSRPPGGRAGQEGWRIGVANAIRTPLRASAQGRGSGEGGQISCRFPADSGSLPRHHPPIVLPALAFGLASLIYFSRLGINLSLLTLVIGHAVVGVPYVMRTSIAALSQLPAALLESSASLGASRGYTFRRITLPLIAPGVAAGAFITFMSSFDNVPVSLFLRDASTDMLPIRMWQDLEGKLDVSIAAVSSLMVLTTLVLMVLMERFTGISKRMR